MTTTARSKP